MPIWMLYTYGSQVTAPPSSGQVRFNAATPMAATLVWVAYLTNDGIDAFYPLTTIPLDAQLFIQDKNDHTQAVTFTVVGPPIDRGAYVEIPVNGDSAAGAVKNNQTIVLVVRSPAVEEPPDTGTPPDEELPPEELPPPVTGEPPVGGGPFLVPPWAAPRACYRVLVTPPAEEPLTVEDAKLLAAMSWPVTTPPDPRDAMIADFIRAARTKVEQDTGLALITQVHDIYILDTVEHIPLPSQCTPTQTIVDVSPVPAPTWGGPPTWGFWGGVWCIPPPFAVAGTVLRVTAGWADAATLRAQAPLLYHAVGLLAAHYATLGRDLAITGAVASVNVVPEGYEDTIAPHKLVWVA
jgi:hypothetical protein